MILSPSFLAAEFFPQGILLITFTFIGFCVICGMIKSLINNHTLQRTIREIAAYTAEGSITPEEAQKMIDAASKGAKRCC